MDDLNYYQDKIKKEIKELEKEKKQIKRSMWKYWFRLIQFVAGSVLCVVWFDFKLVLVIFLLTALNVKD